MTYKREAFPASSIGRVQGANVSRTSSFETLAAHPLLSPNSSSTGTTSPPSGPGEPAGQHHPPNSAAGTAHKYVPYTPRQRTAPPGVPTTAPSAQSSVAVSIPVAPQSQGGQGGATSRLQLVNLRSAAQGIGLDTGSLGWAMLEKLSHEADSSDEWTEIWDTVTKGKACMLLPLSAAHEKDKITPDFMKDHIILCDSQTRDDSPVITLSGLRGTLKDEELTFRSSLNPSTKAFKNILANPARTPLLNALPPLAPLAVATSFPTFPVPAFSSALPLPPKVQKPPLPPRPGARSPAATGSRLANPFASLFGQKPSSTPPTPTVPLPGSSPSTSVSGAQPHTDDHPIPISAFSISRPIYRRDVAHSINSTLTSALASALTPALDISSNGKASADTDDSSILVPPWVLDKTLAFGAPYMPFTRAPAGKKKLQDIGASPGRTPYVVALPLETEVEENSFQRFFTQLDDELHMRLRGASTDKHADGEEREEEVRAIVGIVERALCEVVYDRIFMNGVDDASHDEALSSRVAAVNLVDLTLAHLDVDVGGAADDLNSVITACGQTLQQLDICFSPGDKSAVLVNAHKVLVDGLSKLPPIRLKPSDEENVVDIGRSVKEGPPPLPSGPIEGVDVPLVASPTALVDGSASPLSIPIVMAPDPEPATPPIPESVTLVNSPLGGSTTTTSVDVMQTPLSPAQSPSHRSSSLPCPGSPSLGSLPAPRPSSPLLITTPPTSTPVSGDVLLPLLIFTLAKSNPPHLVSHLLFTQRFRATSVGGGEEAYCLINLLAAASFLENVDLEALGLGDSQKVISAADLSPIPIVRGGSTPDSPSAPLLGIPASGTLRGRVEQQVDAIAGSANKVISGVVDSSFGVLRSFLPTSVPGVPGSEALEKGAIQPNIIRRESGFSIASLAASVAQRRQQTQTGEDGEDGQQLVAVISRPGSVKSGYGDGDRLSDEDDEDDGDGESGGSSEEGSDEEGEEAEEAVERASTHDARSIRSFESMMNASTKSNRSRRSKHKRDIGASGSGGGGSVGGISKSLTDRLASVAGGLGRLSQDKDRDKRSSLLSAGARADSPASVTLSLQRPASPTGSLRAKLAPPNRRFLEATEDDIRHAALPSLAPFTLLHTVQIMAVASTSATYGNASTSSVPATSAAPALPSDLEQTLSVLSAHRTVLGYILLSRGDHLSIIRHSGVIFDGENGRKYASVIGKMVEVVQSGLHEISESEDDGDTIRFMRIRTKRHEIMISPEKRYLLAVLHDPSS
ncbi:hypothetical protein CONPUDRAFT_166692 [Coniophora puteana RWD-64-598 SS2]|uniref:VPS9 domain-containing protein n=1 Tax=Coniophora puteana (strain RWD-64-598) TaxID=741705 RepID=A0A5M3MHT3_CONPW|nr:uncharacterized protein CONPUDRAFT_166692 [Coniophora puteana RWD-64-598 SS2]EIW78762.1 hypothetical protein CONPUDRAFT_166692 [Coniophora puteana RWD-64-598 SS2]